MNLLNFIFSKSTSFLSPNLLDDGINLWCCRKVDRLIDIDYKFLGYNYGRWWIKDCRFQRNKRDSFVFSYFVDLQISNIKTTFSSSVTIAETPSRLGAHCETLEFKVDLFRKMVYDAQSDEEKRKHHLKAANIYTPSARKCVSCGAGTFLRFPIEGTSVEVSLDP